MDEARILIVEESVLVLHFFLVLVDDEGIHVQLDLVHLVFDQVELVGFFLVDVVVRQVLKRHEIPVIPLQPLQVRLLVLTDNARLGESLLHFALNMLQHICWSDVVRQVAQSHEAVDAERVYYLVLLFVRELIKHRGEVRYLVVGIRICHFALEKMSKIKFWGLTHIWSS